MATAGRKKRDTATPAAAPPPPRPIMVTTVRLWRDQWERLQQLALTRRFSGGAARVDASAVLRELLDRPGVLGEGQP